VTGKSFEDNHLDFTRVYRCGAGRGKMEITRHEFATLPQTLQTVVKNVNAGKRCGQTHLSAVLR
jgi:hypothetical protein